jgi:phenol hydroxylase P2 protein
MSNVFIAFQQNDETRAIIDAITADNPHAKVQEAPAMVKIDAEGSLTVKRASIEERMGRRFDLQELHVNLVTLSGHITETDDEFTLRWAH